MMNAVRAVMLVVQHRHGEPLMPDQRGAGAMGDGHHGIDGMVLCGAGQLVGQPAPDGLHVAMRVGRSRPRPVRTRGSVHLTTIPVDHDQLHIGLADVENGGAHGR